MRIQVKASALCLMLALVACTHTQDLDIPEAAQDAIGFDVYTRSSVVTKAGFTGDIDEASFKVAGFGVYAYVGTTPDFMRNQHVTYSGGSWVYSPVKYWPNQDTDKIDFFAYAPHIAAAPYTSTADALANANNEDGILYIPGTDATGDPVIVYKTATDPSNSVDLMFGVAAEAHTSPDVTAGLPFLNMTKLKLGEKMKFNFKHALTKLVVNVDGYFDEVNSGSAGMKEVDANTRIVVESVSISTDRLASMGTLNLHNTTANTPKWDLGDTPVTISGYSLPVASNLHYVDGNAASVVHFSQQPLGVTKTKQSLMGYGIDGTTAASLMFVPNGAGIGNLDVTIVYHVITRDSRLETGHNDVTNTITKTITGLTGNAFKPGYLTTLNLHLGLASVTFDAVVSEEWGDGGALHGNLPSEISLSVGTESIYFWGSGQNAAQTFTATCSGTDVSSSVIWSSDNTDVATVSADGLTVTSGSSYGEAHITGTFTKDRGSYTEIATVSYPVYVNLVSGFSSMTATKTQIVKDEVTTVNAVIEYNGGMGTFGTPPLPVTFEFDDTGLTDNSSAYLTLGSVSHPSPNTVTANVTGKAYGGEGRVIKAVIPAAYTTGGGDLDLSTKVNCAPLGTTGYLFKVNDSGKKVYFARSNLFYTADSEADKKWRLMEHPWSTIESNGGVPTNYGYGNSTVDDVDASLFAWATSGWSGAGSQYMPYSTSNIYPSPYGTNSSLTGDAANADWGVYNTTGGRHIYLFDGNTHLDDGSWRTPTGDYPYGEWAYLVSLSTRRGWATIDIDNDGQENDPDDIYGFVFLPENWNTPSGLSAFDCSYDYDYNPYWNKNVYTREEWDLMEKAGAAFLPAAGSREGTGVSRVRVTGEYWSSTTSVSGAAKYFSFNTNSYGESRNMGRSIRLIRDVN